MIKSKIMAQEKEKWKEIPGFSWYEVSDLGRVRSLKNSDDEPKFMRLRIGDTGYVRVTLQDDYGEKRVMPVHLLVAYAFMGPPRGRIVRHLDGDRSNPKLSNLKYGSRQENEEDKLDHGTHALGEQNSMSLLTKREVKKIFSLKNKMPQDQIAQKFGISRQAVSDIHRGITWSEVTGYWG